MKKLKLLSIILIVCIIGVTSYNYLAKDNLFENIIAQTDYSGDNAYEVLIDSNGGYLVGFENYDVVRSSEWATVYGINSAYKTLPQDVGLSAKGNHVILYFSKDPQCSTRDLEARGGQFISDSSHTVYYACYEETKFNNDGIRYVQENAYVSGDGLSCGDAVKITQCYNEYYYNSAKSQGVVSYCEYDQISRNNSDNFEAASGKLFRNKLSDKLDFNCNPHYTLYFHEDSYTSGQMIDGQNIECGNSTYYEPSVCSSTAASGEMAYTPDSSRMSANGRKFIGWAADDDGNNVNCSGNLVNSNSIVVTGNVHYYACYESEEYEKECKNSEKVLNGKGSYDIKVCYNTKSKNSGELYTVPINDEYDDILKCAESYKLDEISETNIIENTCTQKGLCHKTYKLKCVGGERPKISTTSAMVDDSGYGTIKFDGISSVGIKGWYASSMYQKPTINTEWIYDSRGSYSLSSTPGSVFLWVIDNENQISYAAMTSVMDKVNIDTTLETLEVKTDDGKSLNTEAYAFNEVSNGIVSSDYVRLSNKVNDDSKILASGFNPFNPAYKVTTSSDKIAVYATLTSNDASYVSGYEPRTVNLDYGVNTILIKIKNKKGKERTYTIIATREDDRDATNLLKSLTVSEGKLNFDPYKNDYVVSVGKNKKSVSINGELSSTNASYVDGFGPRKIELKNESTTVALKVKSETGSVRAYTITFVKSGEETTDNNEALLSSLSLSKAYIAFDKNIYDYNTSVDFEIDSINIYALAENGGDSVTLYRTFNGETETLNGKDISLNVGPNNITIVVANSEGKTRTYSVNILRKENGLEISSDTKLSMLDVNGYNINFDPEKFNYEVKIKREKTLVIAATPMSNRAEVYIRGNDNLTAFSIVKIKVVAEDGQSKEYTIDIKKDAYNKKIETIGLVCGLFIIICGIIIIRIKKRRKSINDYYAE